MIRKFLTEFGINVFTSYKTLVPVEDLDKIDDGRKYHIYFITACPKVKIDSKSLYSDSKGINVDLLEQKGENENRIQLKSLLLDHELDHSRLALSSSYPYKTLEITLKDTTFIEKHHKGKEHIVSVPAPVLYSSSCRTRELEVLYIGQSYGAAGNRTAQDRLSSHSTLQKILTDRHSKYPDKQLYILLLEFTPNLNTTFDGISKKYAMTDEEDNAHIESVISDLPQDEQVINITEAALINYFKPNYNTHFVENFPNENHKGYRQYFALDYNCVTVELDLEFDSFPLV